MNYIIGHFMLVLLDVSISFSYIYFSIKYMGVTQPQLLKDKSLVFKKSIQDPLLGA